jgi:glycosyltransferase involved in cell wall biosynthesis
VSRHDVAIYAPWSSLLYERRPWRSCGGGERQMMLLATQISMQGTRVAHIVYPPADPYVPEPASVTLVSRRGYAGYRRYCGQLLEAVNIWRGLRRADAGVYVFRTGTPALGVGALFCRLYRRPLVFSSASDSDFGFERQAPHRHTRALYAFGVRSSTVVVVQSRQQVDLAHKVFPNVKRVVQIPSFAETDAAARQPVQEGEAFLWSGRVVEYKEPLKYVALARAAPEARFWMLGVMDPGVSVELAEQLRAAVAQTPNLELLEPRPHSEAMELVRRSVAVVNTSRFEGMPNTFLEAWAVGVPVLSLSFDADGIIREHGLGNVAGGSWQRFLTAARELWAARGEREVVAERVKAYVRAEHGVPVVTQRWTQLLDELGSR